MEIPVHISVDGLSEQYIDLKDQYYRTPQLQLNRVTPMTAASSQVLESHCAQRKLWVLSSLISRGTGYVCHFSQPRRKCQSCCVICVPGRWHTWLVLINGGSERYQPERGTEESSQASAQLPTNTTERIFPCRYCGCLKSYCVLHYW